MAVVGTFMDCSPGAITELVAPDTVDRHVRIHTTGNGNINIAFTQDQLGSPTDYSRGYSVGKEPLEFTLQANDAIWINGPENTFVYIYAFVTVAN